MRGTIPQSFEERLKREFDDRLRIRWSNRAGEFQIEQKVGTRVEAPVGDDDEDALVRARDGYAYVMSVRDGDRMPCPTCNYTIQVPYLETVHVACPYCKMKGRKTYIAAGYFPLDDNFITYLRQRDPLRGASKELAEAIDRRNKAMIEAKERETLNNSTAAFGEKYNKLVGIPQVGYTGVEFTKKEG